jgi:hypothetical protein
MNRFTCRHCNKETTEATAWWRITSPWPRCCGSDMKWNLFIRFDDKDNTHE